LYFITGGKFEEMHIVTNKVTRFASVLDFNFFFSYPGVVPQKLQETESEPLNMMCIFQVSILKRKAFVDCWSLVFWGKELSHCVSESQSHRITER